MHNMSRILIILLFLFIYTSETISKSGSKSGTAISALTIRRITSELKDLTNLGISIDIPFNNTKDECGVRLSPLKSNLLEWHFSFTGVEGSSYEGGVYHGKIRLHQEYPRMAPKICLLTPSGRWEVEKDICLSGNKITIEFNQIFITVLASAHHQETWNPNWNLRTLVMSLRGFMTTQPREIGSISTTLNEQIALAKMSKYWYCKTCKVSHSRLLSSSLESDNNDVFSKIIIDPIRFVDSDINNNNEIGLLKRESLKKIINRKIKKQKGVKTLKTTNVMFINKEIIIKKMKVMFFYVLISVGLFLSFGFNNILQTNI